MCTSYTLYVGVGTVEKEQIRKVADILGTYVRNYDTFFRFLVDMKKLPSAITLIHFFYYSVYNLSGGNTYLQVSSIPIIRLKIASP